MNRLTKPRQQKTSPTERRPPIPASSGFEHDYVTVKLAALVAVPLGVVITIFPVFAPVGTIAFTCVSESTVKWLPSRHQR